MRGRLAGGRAAVGPALLVLLICALLAVLALGTEALPRSTSLSSEAPDIVVILTDDQRSDTLSVMPQVEEQLVARGVRFTRGSLPTSLCCPSRASLLTGRYAHNTGVWSNKWPYGGAWAFAERGNEHRTMAVALDELGYRTGLVGRYLNGFGPKAAAGYVPPGWDEFVTWTDGSGGYYDYRLNDGGTYGAEPEDYSTDVLSERATEFVRSTPADTRLFLYFAPFAPHFPYTPAARHAGTLAGELAPFTPPSATESADDKPSWIRSLDPIPQATIDETRQQQLETLVAVDEAVAAILDALEDTGRMRDTLVVFTSDNGYFWGEHRMRGKGTPHLAATSVPLVMRWDGQVRPGSTDGRLALNIDITSTIAQVSGAPMTTDGLSLLEDGVRRGFVLEGAAAELSSSTGRNRPAYCGWRTKQWMYARYATGEEELYSYRRDPGELTNLAGRPAWEGQLQRMRGRAQRACFPVPPGFAW